MEAYILFLIFGAALLLAAASLWFSRDPRNSFLMFKVAGLKKMSLEKARQTSRQIASALIGVGLALILFSAVKLIAGN